MIGTYIQEIKALLDAIPLADIDRIVTELHIARMNRRRVYIIGNGGSAATASHFASDLRKGARNPNYPPLVAWSLTDNIPLLTAWGNDDAYSMVFARQLQEGLLVGKSVLIAFSVSGTSDNILMALDLACRSNIKSIVFTGFDGGIAKELADYALIVPSESYEQVEDIHLMIAHMVSVALREME